MKCPDCLVEMKEYGHMDECPSCYFHIYFAMETKTIGNDMEF